MRRRIYVTASWENPRRAELVDLLREAGHEVYDPCGPECETRGFAWADVDADWHAWRPEVFAAALDLPAARAALAREVEAMRWADAVVLVTPCTRAGQLVAGWALGASKSALVLLGDDAPDLMYGLAEVVTPSVGELVGAVGALPPRERERDELAARELRALLVPVTDPPSQAAIESWTPARRRAVRRWAIDNLRAGRRLNQLQGIGDAIERAS